ncbi:MAG: hypothetical protein GY853_00675 [PVC group bacterium]|nr:hypothetical protein [PVC group bacterium]
MVSVTDLFEYTKEQVAELVAPFIAESTYFKARTLTRTMLLELYGINHLILKFDELVLSWTRKVARTLSDLVGDGILEIYSRNSRGRLYKKIKENKEK